MTDRVQFACVGDPADDAVFCMVEDALLTFNVPALRKKAKEGNMQAKALIAAYDRGVSDGSGDCDH